LSARKGKRRGDKPVSCPDSGLETGVARFGEELDPPSPADREGGSDEKNKSASKREKDLLLVMIVRKNLQGKKKLT